MATGSGRAPPPSSSTLPDRNTGRSEGSGVFGVRGGVLRELLPVPPLRCAPAAVASVANPIRIQARKKQELRIAPSGLYLLLVPEKKTGLRLCRKSYACFPR